MTEEIRRALDLYKEWVTKFHFFNGITAEDWTEFTTGRGLSAEEKLQAEEWEVLYSNPAAELNRAHHYIYTLIEEGRESELPDDIRDLIDEWNKNQ